MDERQLQTQTRQESLQTFSPTNDLARIERTIASFGESYKPCVFDKYSRGMSIEKSVAEKSPTFHDISNQYSEEATEFWLRYHIAVTFEFLGIFEQTTKYQIRQTAEMIMQHEIFGQLTLSEFLCFLNRFKQGQYGKIYQSNHPNPQEFLMCLQPFWNELCYWRGRQAEKERQERLSEELHNTPKMTPEEQSKVEEIKKRLINRFKL